MYTDTHTDRKTPRHTDGHEYSTVAVYQTIIIVFDYYFEDNVGGATIWTNFTYTCPRTTCVQYLRILFSSFREEDFQRFCFKFAMVKCLWLLFHR